MPRLLAAILLLCASLVPTFAEAPRVAHLRARQIQSMGRICHYDCNSDLGDDFIFRAGRFRGVDIRLDLSSSSVRYEDSVWATAIAALSLHQSGVDLASFLMPHGFDGWIAAAEQSMRNEFCPLRRESLRSVVLFPGTLDGVVVQVSQVGRGYSSAGALLSEICAGPTSMSGAF